MTFDEFVNKYNGKATDFDGGCGVQCVDLAKMYMYYVCDVKIGAIGNAEAYWNRYDELDILHNNFDRIKNTSDFIPQKGDIVVWGKQHGKYGHIAIADGVGTTSYFYSYDQNWGIKKMHRVKHSYRDGFEGVLRPKCIIHNGDSIEISTPMKLAYAENNKYLFDTEVEQFWGSDELSRNVKDNRLYARATYLFGEGDNCGVQVFDCQFKIRKTCIVKKL